MAKDANQETATVEPAQSNRPEDTKFKQQKLDAWQPILTPAWVIGTFVIVGLVFVPVGAYLFKLSSDLFESVVTYDSADSTIPVSTGISSACTINNMNDGFKSLNNRSAQLASCVITFEFTKDLPEGDQVYLYYQINNFYQNHRRYVKSLSEPQLKGTTVINPVTSTSDSTLETACDPSQSFASGDASTTGKYIFYPCGLIAQSVFNDGIALKTFTPVSGTAIEYVAGNTTTTTQVQLTTTGTAWESDLNNKYKNPTATNCEMSSPNNWGNLCPQRYYQYQYLWQTYDQFLCYPLSSISTDTVKIANLSESPTCTTWEAYVQTLAGQFTKAEWDTFKTSNGFQNYKIPGSGCAPSCAANQVLVPAGGILPPADTQVDNGIEGVRNERFVVWMRTAGLPTFRKLYGRLAAPSGGFKKGDKVSFTVVPNFLVQSIGGAKSLVLGTTSPLGGKNDILGIAYMTVGGTCLFLALIFFIKMRVHPRKLGDPQYLHWKKK
mmetsp:Transcript_11802/g.19231  ORF Transcript_11802/g.19231 Transcript_11802/m.19231 type:complete len:494 (+) Transcript_11802:288-1769(+)|eukprot:CAMPEP_0203747522 /NCGR_PEP_ID=MMETSP0098-20131031/2620_1 /ASSEMBLY_ACC=CAM_ASM_000208 /TAXON_ID=96639 /ORGANISM=" , Strain NY0313808BC1" /LENGTH=493 /DNA_ID=CAMNT_0050635969 /DNA_START=315 /DNA_END=1796 /DNA_ORIENTATION=+